MTNRLLLLLALTVTPFVFTPVALHAEDGATPTDVRIRVAYMLYTQQLNPNLQVVDQVSGSCFAGSLADPGRSDAYRCSSGNRIYDPCFLAAADLSAVACVQTPWSSQATMLSLTDALPSRGENRPELLQAPPWGLELANEAQCNIASTGAGGAIAGERINYTCQLADGSMAGQVVGEIDRSQSSWRVFLTGDDPWTIGQTAVSVAWY
ncbi:MAG TPA: hypothetical protein VH916_05635 [Dehalococcoidia bacterium]